MFLFPHVGVTFILQWFVFSFSSNIRNFIAKARLGYGITKTIEAVVKAAKKSNNSGAATNKKKTKKQKRLNE